MKNIEFEGRQFSQAEFEEYLAQTLPDRHKRVTQLTIEGIKLTLAEIESAKKHLAASMFVLTQLALLEPMIQPLADNLRKEIEGLK